MTDVEELLKFGVDQATLWANDAGIVFLRVGCAVGFLPAFGDQSVPIRIRLIVAILLTAVMSPALAPLSVTIQDAFFPEILNGLFWGILVRILVLALMTAASIAANAASLSQVFPNQSEPLPVVGHLFILGGLAIAFQEGLHIRLVEYLMASYQLLPVAEWPDSRLLAKVVTAQGARAIELALMLSMPFVFVGLLYNLALGAINRAMPQLMVTLIGAPALSLGGLALLALASPLILHMWVDALNHLLTNSTKVVESLAR